MNEYFSKLILAELAKPKYNPSRSRELARDLGVGDKDYPEFRDTIQELLDSEKIIRRKGGRWGLGETGDGKEITGTLSIARAGFGFLLPDDNTLDDLFIPEEKLGSALHGDKVKVQVEERCGSDYRRTGRVLAVLERASPRIVAFVTPEGHARPEDPKNPFDFLIERTDLKFSSTDKILLEVTVWPGEGGEPSGKVLEILGPAGDPDTETAAILHSYNAPGLFSKEVKDEVHALRRNLTPEEKAERLDLTKLVTFTIDPDTARDYDDALSFQIRADGTRVVGVHIADVSWFVRPGTKLEEEARERSTSIYLPERVIPMLPEELSNDLCSLRADEDHLTKTVFLHYDQKGERTGYTIHRSLIRSAKRFTYGEVKTLLEDEAKAAEFGRDDVISSLRSLHELAQQLRQRRLDNGCIELELGEYKIVIDENGHASGIEKCEHDFSHQLVEEFMLAANVAVAEWSANNSLPVLHRVHDSPGEDEVESLAEFLTASGYPFKPPFRRDRINAIIAKTRGKPEEHSINLAILKSFRQAIYAPNLDTGHFALNFPRYLHFTSPIRRYPDLHLHQALDAVFSPGADKLPKKLKKMPKKSEMKNLESLGFHTSGRERRAMKIEEEVKDFRRLELLSTLDQKDFVGVITGIRKFGIFVELKDYFVESMLPREMLEKKGFSTREEVPGKKRHADKGGSAPGFHLGQEVKVRVVEIDLSKRLCELEFVGLA
jgi:ribonuclease R